MGEGGRKTYFKLHLSKANVFCLLAMNIVVYVEFTHAEFQVRLGIEIIQI